MIELSYTSRIAISVMAFILIIVAEHFYRMPLFNWSLEFEPKLQEVAT